MEGQILLDAGITALNAAYAHSAFKARKWGWFAFYLFGALYLPVLYLLPPSAP